MNNYNRAVILKVTPKCIAVDFSSLVCFKSRGEVDEIRKYWNDQGYVEAEFIPYQRTPDGLIVQRNLETFGWAVAGDVCEEVYNLPF